MQSTSWAFGGKSVAVIGLGSVGCFVGCFAAQRILE
jgi:hypothetical protein